MAADSNTSFEFQIASESKEAEKGIEKIIKVAKELEDKLEALQKKSDILFSQAKGDKITKSTAKDKQRLNYVLQYYSIQEKIQNIANKAQRDIQKQAEAEARASAQAKKRADAEAKAAEARKKASLIASQVNSRTKFYSSASPLDLLYQKRFNTQNSLQSAIASGDDKKAVASAEQLLRIDRDIEKEKNRVAEEQKKINAESNRTLEVVERIKSVASNIGSVLKSLGGKAIAKITEPFKRMQKSIKTLFSSVGRIAFYRAIRSAIKAVTQGFSEGVKHLYAWSEAFDTKFAPAMDQYKTQMTYLHNGFAAMFSPLIEWVIPNVLTPLTDAMVEFFNFVQQGFATLVGHDYWYKAQKSMTKFGEATKKANIQLAKFDELNNLTESGSGSEEDASGMFTLEKVSADFGKGFFKEIRDEINNGDWYGVGNTIATKLNDGIGNFDSRGLASTIAGKINNAINLALGFAENFDFAQLGTKIGGFIDQAIKDIEWDKAGLAAGNMAGGFLVLILSAIEEIDVAEAVDAFFSFLSSAFGGFANKLFEDNGYHVKMLALKLAEFALAIVHNALSLFRKGMKKLNIFNNPSDALFAKSLGLSEDAFNTVSDTNEYLAYNAWLAPIKEAEEELKKSHEQWLADQSKTTENSVTKLSSNVVEIFRKTGSNSVRAYQSADWGTTIPTNQIKYAVTSSGIPFAYSKQATQALSAYTAVQWASGGTVSAEGIKNALIQAGVPASMALQASQSLASFINTLNGGKGDVTNALNNMTSGYDGNGVGQRIGRAIADGIATTLKGSQIVNGTVTSSNGRITYTMNARGGYLFANGGFASGLSQGTMYVAGEVPGQAEMVGQINGRTGVASGFEITGIRDAVISTGENEAQLLQRLISVLERKNLVISPSAQLGRVMAQSNRLYSGVTG